MRIVLRRLYLGMIEPTEPVTDEIPEKDQRNFEIYTRYMNGERAVDLATEFHVSVRRVNKLVRRYINRN